MCLFIIIILHAYFFLHGLGLSTMEMCPVTEVIIKERMEIRVDKHAFLSTRHRSRQLENIINYIQLIKLLFLTTFLIATHAHTRIDKCIYD